MEKHTVVDLMPVLKKRKCNCFESCNLMIYGPWTKVGEASMEKGSPSKIRLNGRKQKKVNVGVQKGDRKSDIVDFLASQPNNEPLKVINVISIYEPSGPLQIVVESVFPIVSVLPVRNDRQ